MRKWFVNHWETVFVTAVVLIGTIIRFCIVAQDLDFLVATFLPDDAFYYFTIARNFVNGNGISFDSFSPTNGFHPLWLFLITPLFSFEGELPIRLTLFVSATIDMFTAVIIYRFLKELLKQNLLVTFPAVIVLFAWAFSPFTVRQALNGLETSLNNMFLVLAVYVTVREQYKNISIVPRHSSFILPLFWGGALLSRTDNVLFWISAVFILLVTIPRWRRGRSFIALMGIPILIVTPWIIWNLFTFGTFMQSSGVAMPQVIRLKYFSDLSGLPSTKLILEHAFSIFATDFKKLLFFSGFSISSVFSISLLSILFIIITPQVVEKIKSALIKTSFLFIGSLLWFLVHDGIRWMTRDWYFIPLVFIVWMSIAILLAGAFSSLNVQKWWLGNVFVVVVVLWQMWSPMTNLWSQLMDKLNRIRIIEYGQTKIYHHRKRAKSSVTFL